jgi:hypothetical protein
LISWAAEYGFAVPIAEATALAVTVAVVQHVLPHWLGRPPRWVLDGGSKFKNVLEDAVKAWEAVPYPSPPNHPQSHGLIERYNRTLSNKTAKLLEEHGEALWTDVISVATEIVNNLVQEVVSDRDAWLAPSEIWFARNPVLQSLSRVSVEPPTNVSRYVQRLKRHWEIVNECVQTSGG